MTQLIIETSAGALSVALLSGAEILAEQHRIVGRGHAEHLLPAIAEVMAGQQPPGRIAVDTGPGSFTGLRVGIAAARALGLGWRVEVVGISATALIAASAFAAAPHIAALGVVIDAGRGRFYVQRFDRDAGATGAIEVLSPTEAIASLYPTRWLAGSGAAALRSLGEFEIIAAGEPRAADARWLTEPATPADTDPLYLGASMPAVAA